MDVVAPHVDVVGVSTPDVDERWRCCCGRLRMHVCRAARLLSMKEMLSSIGSTIMFVVQSITTKHVSWAIGHAVFAPVVFVACILLRRRGLVRDNPAPRYILFYLVVLPINIVLLTIGTAGYIYDIVQLQGGQLTSPIQALTIVGQTLSTIISIVAEVVTKRAYDFVLFEMQKSSEKCG